MKDILVGIPTKRRQRVLGRCLAALLAQTFTDYDLLIMNDDLGFPPEEDPVTKVMIERHRLNRKVWLVPGAQLGPPYNHNIALWQSPWRDYPFILRLDDDVLLNPDALNLMQHTIRSDDNIGAVSGLWFESEVNNNWFSDRDIPTEKDWNSSLELKGRAVDGVVSNWAQRLYHYHNPSLRQADIASMPVQHLYSSCLYRSEDMRRVGGWPEIYSHGVCHSEETDGTHRLYLSGRQLLIVPSATGQHLRSPGGIRSMGTDIEHKTRQLDIPKATVRLKAMPGMLRFNDKQPLRVGVMSQHAQFTGGGPRLYFQIVQALQSFKDFEVYPVGVHMAAELAADKFGLTLQAGKPTPEVLDVLIRMGDDIERINEQPNIPPAAAESLFVYYPFGEQAPNSGQFKSVSTLSNFVTKQIAHKWNVESRYIYPYTQPIAAGEKENIILVVGRIDPWKGTLWLMQVFERSGLAEEGWRLWIAGATTGSREQDYIRDVLGFAQEHKGISVFIDDDDEHMRTMYGKAEILWAAKGYMAEPDNLQESEHFGMTPVEAISAGCIPLVYDLGGHRETTPSFWRWKTETELIFKTRQVMAHYDERTQHSMFINKAVGQVQFAGLLESLLKLPARAKVAVWCQAQTIAGEQRMLSFAVMDALQRAGYDPCYIASDDCVSELEYDIAQAVPVNHEDVEYDATILIGNKLFGKNEVMINTKRRIAYLTESPKDMVYAADSQDIWALDDRLVDRLETATGINVYCVEPATFPLVNMHQVSKKNTILMHCLPDDEYNPLEYANLFVNMELQGWKLVVLLLGIGTPPDALLDFQVRNPNVIFLCNPDGDQLLYEYACAKLVWNIGDSERGYKYRLALAVQANAIPLYKSFPNNGLVTGGYDWLFEDQLKEITQSLVIALHDQDISQFTDWQRFCQQWQQVVLQTNAHTVELQPAQRIKVLDRPLSLACISDSPRLTSGFGVVASQLYKYFLDEGFRLHVMGIMDELPAMESNPLLKRMESFWPCPPEDPMGERAFPRFAMATQPDVIWMLYDPGSLHNRINQMEFSLPMIKGSNRPPLVVYTPIEGKPISESHGFMMNKVQTGGGVVVTYCQSGADAIRKQFPEIHPEVAYHGLDHANFRAYSDAERKRLKQLVGLDGKFVIGAVGVNKRTKELPTLIYVAKYLRETGQDKDIIFYVHTEAKKPVLQGYELAWLAHVYGVEDMFLWKPDTMRERGGMYFGVEFDNLSQEQLFKVPVPSSAKERGFLFGHMDMISRYNLMDCYVDCSSAEGWGLPVMESILCGVPAISIDDGMVRSEILTGAWMLQPDFYSTWHTGALLPQVKPESVAKAILNIRALPELVDQMKENGQQLRKFTWQNAAKTMIRAVKGAAGYER